MAWSLKSPDDIVPFRTLAQLLAARPGGVHAARRTATARAALQAMAEKRVGFLVVLQGEKLAGVLSERDDLRKLVITTAAVFVVIGVYCATGIV
jgi:CBS domain-containing protein